MTYPWRIAWLTGASSGIGRALAIRLAEAGATVVASARRGDELETLSRAHDGIMPIPLDVTDRSATGEAVERIHRDLGPVDLAILNAGVGLRMGIADFNAERVQQAMAVNYMGVVNGIDALLPIMRERRRGHIGLVSSLAGYRGIVRSAAYSPSKAAVISLGECLKPEFDAAGLRISIINPGFVETPMTANAKHPLPFVMSADEAACRILAGLEKGRFEISFPWKMVALLKLARVLPYALYFRMMPGGDRDPH